jgi:hypothetical protein
VRRKDGEKVFAVFNFSSEPQTVTLGDSLYHGQYIDYFSREAVEFSGAAHLDLPPWGYRVFVR